MQAFSPDVYKSAVGELLAALSLHFGFAASVQFRRVIELARLAGELGKSIPEIGAKLAKKITMGMADEAIESMKEIFKVGLHPSCASTFFLITISSQAYKGRIHLAFDGWTSPNQLAMIAIIAITCDENYQLHYYLIDFIEIQGAHSGANTASLLFQVIKDYNIIDKVSNQARFPYKVSL